MYVCVCNGVTDKEIRKAVARGAGTLQELHDRLGVASQCGSCAEHAMSLIEDHSDAPILNRELFYAVA